MNVFQNKSTIITVIWNFYLLKLSGRVLKTRDSEEELEITPNNISYLITDWMHCRLLPKQTKVSRLFSPSIPKCATNKL